MSIIEFKNTSKHFGPLKVLDGVNLSIDAGEVVVLIGPSGSGKSTLLRCINGLETITGGDLIVDGLSVTGSAKQLREIRQEAGMVFQQFNLFPQLTALETCLGPRGARPEQAQAHERHWTCWKGRAARQGRALSVGTVRRSATACGDCSRSGSQAQGHVVRRTHLGAGPELKQEVLNVMRALAEEGMTMVVVTHEMGFAKQVGTRLIFMEHGHIAVDGDPSQVIDTPPNDRMKDFLQHV